MKKMIIPALFISALLVSCSNPTYESSHKEIVSKGQFVNSSREMDDNSVYIWHNTGRSLSEDLSGSDLAFQKAAIDRASFEVGMTEAAYDEEKHILWYSSQSVENIPVVYEKNGDAILLTTSNTGDISPIVWERYKDYGYTIGLANLQSNAGHFFVPTKQKRTTSKNKNPYIAHGSDVSAITGINVDMMYLDKVGGMRITSVSDAGTIEGLSKDETYIAEFYIGSYYQDFAATASERAFANFERFTHPFYEYTHSECIKLEIPPYLKSGYYLIQGYGFIKYVASGDSNDSPTDIPIVTYNPDGTVKDDPSIIYGREGDAGIEPGEDD